MNINYIKNMVVIMPLLTETSNRTEYMGGTLMNYCFISLSSFCQHFKIMRLLTISEPPACNPLKLIYLFKQTRLCHMRQTTPGCGPYCIKMIKMKMHSALTGVILKFMFYGTKNLSFSWLIVLWWWIKHNNIN